MSGGVLPPVPDLIPISALQGRSMGEQRPRRRAPDELIDTAAGSRASSAAPLPPPRSRPARPGQRRRKSDRRREQRRPDSVRSVSKQDSRIRSSSPSIDRPPRVNPIFVWVRQEDTRIVDVKCEDYDKRNRILLTKTAHGWRAIPRTETMVPTKPPTDEDTSNHHHHHHRKRPHKHKSRRKSVSLQFPENLEHLDYETVPNASETTWINPENVNIESLLPSHTIQIRRTPSPDKQYRDNVNRNVNDLGHAPPKCSAPNKVCDVSPLDNLLAVAELEFKQQMESGIWKNDSTESKLEPKSCQIGNQTDQINCAEQSKMIDDMKIEECDDYNEDDDGIAMNDILSRLQQSLESPENEEHSSGSVENINNSDNLDVASISKILHECSAVPEEVIKNKFQQENIDSVDSQQLGKTLDTYFPKPGFVESVESPKEPNDNSCIKQTENCLILSESSEKQEFLQKPCLKIPTLESIESKKYLQESESIKSIEHFQKPSSDELLKIPLLPLETIEPKENNQNIYFPEPALKTVENEPPDRSIESNYTHLTDNVAKQETHELILNKIDANCAPILIDNKTNILEILSKEVEKIEPIRSKIIFKKEEQPQPLDFSIKSKTTILTINTDNDDIVDGPTDLTVKKLQSESPEREKRPFTQNSEAIQSPQPSGIPAILHSPDIVSTSTATSVKNKSAFLESLLTNSTNKRAPYSEVTVTKQSEPMQIENRRKSASPTVTCSEEIINKALSDVEPPTKKFKPNDITLKQLLNKEENLENVVKSLSQESRSTSTPALLELLKDPTELTDPLTEFKKLLLEVDIPEPLMVPKERFVNLLKKPREEIFNLMKDKSYKNLKIDDILVVYKDKLFAALEANAKLEKTISESKPNQILERKDSQGDRTVSSSNKRKHSDISPKNSSPETGIKHISAGDIDAATEAAFSQMMMFPYQTQLEAMSWASNQQDLLQSLYGSSPLLPGQMNDIHPSIQMMLGNTRIPSLSPLSYNSFPSMNFTNPLEFSMWQEAMLQASLLRNKSAFENSMLNQPVSNFQSQIPSRRSSSSSSQIHSNSSRNQSSSRISSQSMQEQHLLQRLYEQNNISNHQNYHNPYLGQASFQQRNSATLNIPQYSTYQHKSQSNRSTYHHPKEPNSLEFSRSNIYPDNYREHEKRLQQQMLLERQKSQQKQQQERLQREHRLQDRLSKQTSKPTSSSSKPFSINSFAVPKSVQPQQELQMNECSTRQGGYQPIDLSGSQSVAAKAKTGVSNIEQRTDKSYVSMTGASKCNDDVAEVGSTTASIEEMQDANIHLWHPLFGSDKGYSPWNMPSSVAAAE